jgi:hypothetical protein
MLGQVRLPWLGQVMLGLVRMGLIRLRYVTLGWVVTRLLLIVFLEFDLDYLKDFLG